MKIKVIPTIIAAAISALIAYGLFSFCKTPGLESLLAIGGFISLFLTLATCLGVRFDQSRTSANIAVIGGVFFFILLVSHLFFTLTLFNKQIYLIINGIILLLFLLTLYGIAKAKQ